jgi:hypothetical protein
MEKEMPQHRVLRLVVLAGVLAALAVPAATLPIPGVAALQTVSACSTPSCVITGTVSGAIDTYYSPITLSVTSVVIAEHQLTGQPTTTVSVPGTLSLSINDRRGNNEGFVVSVSSNGFSTRLSSTMIPPSSITVSNVTSTLAACLGVGNIACSPVIPLPASYGKSLDSPVSIAAQCPSTSIGMGLYNIGMGLNVGLSGSTAEVFGFAPASWYGSFNVAVDESLPAVQGVCGVG